MKNHTGVFSKKSVLTTPVQMVLVLLVLVLARQVTSPSCKGCKGTCTETLPASSVSKWAF